MIYFFLLWGWSSKCSILGDSSLMNSSILSTSIQLPLSLTVSQMVGVAHLLCSEEEVEPERKQGSSLRKRCFKVLFMGLDGGLPARQPITEQIRAVPHLEKSCIPTSSTGIHSALDDRPWLQAKVDHPRHARWVQWPDFYPDRIESEQMAAHGGGRWVEQGLKIALSIKSESELDRLYLSLSL